MADSSSNICCGDPHITDIRTCQGCDLCPHSDVGSLCYYLKTSTATELAARRYMLVQCEGRCSICNARDFSYGGDTVLKMVDDETKSRPSLVCATCAAKYGLNTIQI